MPQPSFAQAPPLPTASLAAGPTGVANHLLGLGARPDDIIGIYTDRSIDMIVGLMGILKAGSPYTLLDPGFPEDRIEFMLQDSNSRILITQNHLMEKYQRLSRANDLPRLRL